MDGAEGGGGGVTQRELDVIRFELNEFRGDPMTMNARDAHGLALLVEVDRLRKALQAIAATAGLNGTTAAKIVRFAKSTLEGAQS